MVRLTFRIYGRRDGETLSYRTYVSAETRTRVSASTQRAYFFWKRRGVEISVEEFVFYTLNAYLSRRRLGRFREPFPLFQQPRKTREFVRALADKVRAEAAEHNVFNR